MQYVDLLCGSSFTPDLRRFAEIFFQKIGIKEYEERSSSNYTGELYYTGRNKYLSCEIFLSDEKDHVDMAYYIQITSDTPDEESLATTVGDVVHTKLLPAGFHVVRVINLGKAGEKRIEY